MSERPNRLGQMLRLFRAARHLTMRDVAKETGISSATIMRIEHGYPMDVATFLRLTKWLFEVPHE